MASSRKTGPAKRSSDDNHDPGVGSSRPLGPRHRQPSTDTVVHHPQTRKENLRPTTASTNPRTNTNEVLGLRTVRVYTGLNNVLGFTDRPTSASDSYPALTRQPNWKTPESIRQVIDHQNKRFGEPKPKESSFAQQSLTRNRVFDPEDGKQASALPPTRRFLHQRIQCSFQVPSGPIYSSCTQCDPSGGVCISPFGH